MIDAIVKIIDRFIDLAKRREQTNRNLFNDFVAPTFNDFEVVHKAYLDSFFKYVETLRASDNFGQVKENFIRQINQDILFSESSRSKLIDLVRWETDPQIGEFISSILRYIRFDSTRKTSHTSPNKIRLLALIELDKNFRDFSLSVDERIVNGTKILTSITNNICNNYSVVICEYNNLKDRLLR